MLIVLGFAELCCSLLGAFSTIVACTSTVGAEVVNLTVFKLLGGEFWSEASPAAGVEFHWGGAVGGERGSLKPTGRRWLDSGCSGSRSPWGGDGSHWSRLVGGGCEGFAAGRKGGSSMGGFFLADAFWDTVLNLLGLLDELFQRGSSDFRIG